MRRLTREHGDLALTWDVTDKASVDTAIAEMDKMLSEGHLAFRTGGPDGDTQIREFQPDAEEIFFVRPLQGG